MKFTQLFRLAAMVLFAWFCFCPGRSVAAGHSPADTGYTPGAVAAGGTISGVITFDGEMPAITRAEVTKDREVCGKAKPSEALLVHPENKGIENVVVHISGIKSGKEWPEGEMPTVAQKGCVFTPHVLIVPAGREFLMVNNDGILHNVHSHSEINKAFNKAQPKFLKKMKLKLEKPEFVKLSCDVHNWMAAWVVASDNPYFALTDARGHFELTDVPAGVYEVEIWQEKLGAVTRKVEVKAGAGTTLDAVLSPQTTARK